MLLASSAAHAGAVAVATDAAECRDPTLDLQASLKQEPACLRDAAFLHRLGRLLNEAKLYADAAERLEAAILLEPERWGAQLDFAVALAGLGDRVSAENLWRDLSHNSSARVLLEEALVGVDASDVMSPAHARTLLGVATGYDDNLMGATRYSSFNLTLPSANLPVELGDAEQQRGGRFVRIDLGYDTEFGADPAARWRYSLIGSHSASIDYTPANLSLLTARLERAPKGEQGWYGVGLGQYQQRGAKSGTYQGQLGGGFEWSGALAGFGCRVRLGVETLATHYADSGFADGRYVGLLSYWVCPGAQIQIQLRAGNDLPVQAARLGGAQRQYDLRVSRVFLLGGGALTTEFDYFHQRDRQGYSPLLENNAPRTISRATYRAEYRWSYGTLSPYIGLEYMSQRSNLPLFAPRNRVVSLGVRQAW